MIPRVPFAFALVLALPAALAAPALALDWEPTSLPSGYVYRLAASPAGPTYAFGGGSVYVSNDDGESWSPVAPFVPGRYVGRFAIAPDGALFASDFALGLYRSTNGGLTWSGDLVTEGCDGIAVHPGGVVLAGLTYTGNGKVHRSTNAGDAWQSIALPGASGGSATSQFGFGSQGESYAGSIDGFYRSLDQGLTWTRLVSGLSGLNVRSLAVLPNDHVVIETLFPASFDGLYRSVDRGDSWVRLSGSAPYVSALVAGPDGTLYGAEDTHVWQSVNEGATWTNTGAGIPANEALASLVLTASGRLLAGGRRVWRSTSFVTGVASDARPAGLALAPIEPNPVAGRARVRFTLARAGEADLALFDTAGRRVATLARGRHEAREYVVEVDGSALAPGVYLCRLVADERAFVRRLLFVR